MVAGFPSCLFTCSLSGAFSIWILKRAGHLALLGDAHTLYAFLFLRPTKVKLRKKPHCWSYLRISAALLFCPEAGLWLVLSHKPCPGVVTEKATWHEWKFCKAVHWQWSSVVVCIIALKTRLSPRQPKQSSSPTSGRRANCLKNWEWLRFDCKYILFSFFSSFLQSLKS